MNIGTRSKFNLRLAVDPLLKEKVELINTERYYGYKGVGTNGSVTLQ